MAEPANPTELLRPLVRAVQEEAEADLLLYNGVVDYPGFRDVLRIATSTERRSNVILFLTTLGGDAHAAFRIARCLQTHYQKYTIAITSMCKSAGTLVALGAHEMVIGGAGELGPLDVQIRKPDEILVSESGLDIIQALTDLTQEALSAFRETLLDIITGAGLSTKASTDIATELVTGLYGQIFSQIDPVRLGAVARANRIGMHYGSQIGTNLKPRALAKLVSGYPSHSCVIDQQEARELFQQVREFTGAEKALLSFVGPLLDKPGLNAANVLKLEPSHEPIEETQSPNPGTDGQPVKPNAGEQPAIPQRPAP